MIRLLLIPVVLVFLFFGGVGLFAFFRGRGFIYHPTATPEETLTALGSKGGWVLEHVEVDDGVRVFGLVHKPASPDSPWFLMFGGNAASLTQNHGALARIGTSTTAALGLAVYAYRGYDGSDAVPTEPDLVHDALVLTAHVIQDHGARPDRLTLIGQSLGTGVATQVAAELSKDGMRPRALVLVSPYSSIAQVADDHIPIVPVGWALRDPWRTDRVITDVKCPVLLVHGGRDDLISIGHSRRLAALLGGRARFVELPERDHNDMWEARELIRLLRDLD